MRETNRVPHIRSIELLLDDLTQIPPEHAVDVLVVSAFPGDYSPTPNSLIGALHRRGLNVAKLWLKNQTDLREYFSCWLSQEIQTPIADALVAKGLKVFVDRAEIEVGAAWQQKIFDALEECMAAAVLYSPAFLESKVCKEEFGIAWARRRDNEKVVVFPLLLRKANLPTYMRLINYSDCCVCDRAKIEAAAGLLASSLRAA